MSYEHGRFVWFELLTKDVDRATSFYPETLPWKIETATASCRSRRRLSASGRIAPAARTSSLRPRRFRSTARAVKFVCALAASTRG